MEKQKSESDRKLIANLTGVEPLDWCKRENGDLVYLNQAGQKFVLTPAEIDALMYKKQAQVEKAPEANQNPRSHHKKVLDSMPEEKELTVEVEQAPYDVEPTPEEKSLGELGQIEADDL
jgi:cytochrome oxidase assembly protein ShyY1